tara:strand:- start:70084 stop:71262 length:1179 start_codon:yes stop_codon:yes gene_type:complete
VKLKLENISGKSDPDALYDYIQKTTHALYGLALDKTFISSTFSPFSLELPSSILKQIESFSYDLQEALYQLPLSKTNEHRQKFVDRIAPYPSVLMALDLHFDTTSQKVKLIEVNTNASSFLVADLLIDYESRQKLNNQRLDDLLDSFEASYDQWKPAHPLKSIAIIDAQPQKQFMYPEFLLYKKLFSTRGWSTVIGDITDAHRQPGKPLTVKETEVDFIYNRHTDFEFESSNSKPFLEAYLNREACFSPHPLDYIYQADKSRLVDLYGSNPDESIRQHLLSAEIYKPGDEADKIWEKRKKLFFKPTRSHGGKGVYRGKSISRKKFQELCEREFLYQEFCPPDTAALEEEEWKYDIRAYLFNGSVQMCAARVFQGQVTNFSKPLSGFARIDWV